MVDMKALRKFFSCGFLGYWVYSPLTFLVEDSGAFGAVSLVALQLMEAVTCILFGLSVLWTHTNISLHLWSKVLLASCRGPTVLDGPPWVDMEPLHVTCGGKHCKYNLLYTSEGKFYTFYCTTFISKCKLVVTLHIQMLIQIHSQIFFRSIMKYIVIRVRTLTSFCSDCREAFRTSRSWLSCFLSPSWVCLIWTPQKKRRIFTTNDINAAGDCCLQLRAVLQMFYSIFQWWKVRLLKYCIEVQIQCT